MNNVMGIGRKSAAYLGGLLIVCLLGLAILFLLTLRERSRVDSFLHDFLKLQPGKASFTDAQQLAQVYGGLPWYTEAKDMRCTFQRCSFRFAFANRPLTSAHLARYIELLGWVFVRDGVVIGREIDYVRDAGRVYPFEYEVIEAPIWTWTQDGTMHQREGGLWRLKVNDEGMPSVVKINLTASSTADERKRAYSLDLSCFARVFDCDNPSVMFPRGIEYRGAPYQSHSATW